MTDPLPASAAAPAGDLISGAHREGIVLAVLSAAVILEVGGRVITLLGPGATGVPNGIRPAGGLPAAVRGDLVSTGNGLVRLPRIAFRIVRTWRTAVRPIAVRPDALDSLAGALREVTIGLAAGADDALRQALRDSSDPRGAVRGLVGLGLGLTPAGDDLLSGVLVAMHAQGNPAGAAVIATAIEPAATTMMSAELLRLAAAGHAAIEMLGLLDALHRGDGVRAAADRLIAVGHTSGADLTTGLLIGLTSGQVGHTAGGDADPLSGTRRSAA